MGTNAFDISHFHSFHPLPSIGRQYWIKGLYTILTFLTCLTSTLLIYRKSKKGLESMG